MHNYRPKTRIHVQDIEEFRDLNSPHSSMFETLDELGDSTLRINAAAEHPKPKKTPFALVHACTVTFK